LTTVSDLKRYYFKFLARQYRFNYKV
jgi:hypothetical protein